MNNFTSILLVFVPFVLQGLTVNIPAGAEIQRALFIAFPIIGLIVSVIFAFIRKKGRWFYTIAGVLYGILLFFSIAFIGWKQT